MTKLTDLPRLNLPLYATAAYPCSYLLEQQARSQVVTPPQLVNTENYSALLEAGFRRSGLFTYRPYCDHCHACIPVRLEIAKFRTNRSQQRAWRRHATLHVTILPLSYHAEHYQLYLDYQSQRHPGGGMDEDSQTQYTQFLLESKIDTRLIEFRDPPIAPHTLGQLRMVSIVDVSQRGLSSVYTFYDTRNPRDSFGTFNILWQIKYAAQLHLPFLYLGYWIKESRKMAYKANFQPLQALINDQWQMLDTNKI